jgi:hypothetical protein
MNRDKNDFLQDAPQRRFDDEKDIHEQCNRHSQLMEKIGELVVGLQYEKNRREEMIAERRKVTDSLTKLMETEIKLINMRLDNLENKNTDLINARLVAVLERVEEKIKQGL